MKILFISRWFPYPPNNGSKLRVLNLIRGLSEFHDVTLLSFLDDPEKNQNANEIRSFCSDVYTIPWKAYDPKGVSAQIGYISGTPRSIRDTFSQDMALQIQQLVSSKKFDCVIASQTDAASYQRYFPGVPAIFEELEIGVLYGAFANANSLKSYLRNGLTWAKYRRYLVSLLENYCLCTVVSQKEKDLVKRYLPETNQVEVVPNCINFREYQGVNGQPEQDTLIFTGSFNYFPNYNAMLWFVENVLPRIKSQIPDVKLVITGDHANKPFPSDDNVVLTGYIDDIRSIISNSWLSIAPIFEGGGTRLKILEAMALKTPVVATSKGAEGLDVVDGNSILIADTADDFANAVLRVLTSLSFRSKVADEAYQLVKKYYDWSIVIPEYSDLIQKTVYQKSLA